MKFLSAEKWDKLDKSGMVFPQPCLITHIYSKYSDRQALVNSVDPDQMLQNV